MSSLTDISSIINSLGKLSSITNVATFNTAIFKINSIPNNQNDILLNNILGILNQFGSLNNNLQVSQLQNIFSQISSVLSSSNPSMSGLTSINRIIKESEPVTLFEQMAMITGDLTKISHHFFGNIANTIGTSDSLDTSTSGSYPFVYKGVRLPSNVTTKNPALTMPNVSAMKYLAQSPIEKVAMDQIIPKKVGVFPTPTHGAACNIFDFNNNNLFSSSTDTLKTLFSKILLGSNYNSVVTDHPLDLPLTSIANTGGQAVGADMNTIVNVRDAQHVTYALTALSAGFANTTTSPFNISSFNDGYSLYNEINNYLKSIT